MLVQHVQTLPSILISQRLAGAFQGLPATVTQPGPRQIPPRLERRSVNDGRRLAQTVSPADIDRVGAAIPYQLDRRKGMIPTEIHPADARPMPGKLAVLNRERLLLHREDATAAKNRDALGARLNLVRCIAGCDPRLVRLGEVRRVVNRRANHGAVRMHRAAARKEALDDSAHPEQGRKAQIYDPAGFIGSRESFAVDTLVGLLVEIDNLQRGALPFLSTTLVAFELKRREAAADVSDVDDIDCGRDTARCGNPSDGGLWNHPRAPFGFPKGRAYQLLLQNVARGLAGDTGSPRSHRLVKALAIPPFRVIPGQVKRQLGCAARGFAKTVCTHEQAFTVLGAGFMKGGLLGIWAIVHKLVLGRTLRLHRLKSSYGGLDLLRRQAVNV